MAQAAIPLTIASTILGVGAQAAAGETNAAIAEENAKLAKKSAKRVIKRGQEMSNRVKSMQKRVVGSQRAVLAAQGVVVDIGTAADLQDDTVRAIEQDMITIRNNARLEAWGFKVEKKQFQAQARLTRQQTVFGGVGTVLGGAAGIARIRASQGALSVPTVRS